MTVLTGIKLMTDMANNGKPWWDSQLDWNLPDNLHESLRLGRNLLRNIPQTLTAYRLGKTSPIDTVEPDPVEKIKGFEPVKRTPQRPLPRIMPPPPKPPTPVTMGIPRGVNMPKALPPTESEEKEKVDRIVEAIEKKKLTLENLLDPNFTDYR
jgi:hypothetical protein